MIRLQKLLSVECQVLNRLHTRLGCEGYTEIGVTRRWIKTIDNRSSTAKQLKTKVHFLADDALAIERRSPDNGHSVWQLCSFDRSRSGEDVCNAYKCINKCSIHEQPVGKSVCKLYKKHVCTRCSPM